MLRVSEMLLRAQLAPCLSAWVRACRVSTMPQMGSVGTMPGRRSQGGRLGSRGEGQGRQDQRRRSGRRGALVTPPPGFLQVEPWLRGSGAGSILGPEFPFRHLVSLFTERP